MSGWIGIDLDGTLSHYESGQGIIEGIGAAIPRMIVLVREYIGMGHEVRIVTARVAHDNKDLVDSQRQAIQDWLELQGLPRLAVVSEKDYGMIMLFDDRAVGVENNTGMICYFCMNRLRVHLEK